MAISGNSFLIFFIASCSIPLSLNEYSASLLLSSLGITPKTIKTYKYCVEKFLNYYKKDINKITKKDVKDYMDKLIEKKNAGNTLNVNLNSIKFLMENILGKKLLYNIKYSKVPKTLPTVLTKEEIRTLFDNIKNSKHKLLAELMYSAGLRVNELVNLRVMDFEFNKNYGWVRRGKGNKDRLFIVAKRLNERLQEFIEENKLNYESYLFKGNKRNHISKETINMIIKNSGKKAGINKRIHCHTLRHSFATHLIEDGYSVSDVQSLLGHKSPETTMIYVHMASPKMINIKSPLDSL